TLFKVSSPTRSPGLTPRALMASASRLVRSSNSTHVETCPVAASIKAGRDGLRSACIVGQFPNPWSIAVPHARLLLLTLGDHNRLLESFVRGGRFTPRRRKPELASRNGRG